tara:strand:+ start:1978 stop:3096 length:1119 start_codon:yes stop_codon:yes gene_type:complete
MADTKYCSPANDKNKYTCYSDEALGNIARAYNTNNPEDIIDTTMGRQSLWDTISKKLLNYTPNCNADHCLLKHPSLTSINKKLIEHTFRPEIPIAWEHNPTTWLSTVDIREVMKQYEAAHSDFVFIGPVPIDFDGAFRGTTMCVSEELCKIDMTRHIKAGKFKLGVIFNLDPHTSGGSHWVSMFMNVYSGGIYYFDSFGAAPPEQVQALMQRLKDQTNTLIRNGIIPLHTLDDSHSKFYEFTKKTQEVIILDTVAPIQTDSICYIVNSDIQNLNVITAIHGKEVSLLHPIKCKLSSSAPENCHTIVMKEMRSYYNTVVFQKKNTECGVYSMHFIDELLNGKTFDEVSMNIIGDDEMERKRREYYYRPLSIIE